jgi:hypothetical protein
MTVDAPGSDASPSDADGGVVSDSASPNDGPSEAEPPPNPCYAPNLYFLSCDPACLDPTGSTTTCDQSKCGPTVTVDLPDSSALPFFVRTPNAPGVDPTCAAECPSESWVYGLGFQLTQIPYAWTVKVDPPWMIFVAQVGPYCANMAFTPRNCITLQPGTSGTLFVMTTDPNAPARNILFDSANQASCP